MLSFTKVRAASQSHGRGPDNRYTPGLYAIVVGDHQIGYIRGAARRFMEPASWTVYTVDHRPVGFADSLAKAKRAAAYLYATHGSSLKSDAPRRTF